ncbi:MAG: hydrogenase, partial [Spirochaetia bacterium]|nr:hydrogenase [Spirochaetia bacterium]
FPIILSAVVTMLLKGVIIPKIMIKALRDVQIKREVEPIIGILASTIVGAVGTAFIFLIFRRVNSAVQLEIVTLLPTAFATILIGFILLTTRVKALSQVLGYLVLENGIYLFSMLLFEAIPLVVEMGMLLDLFVSIFIISIITNHINRAFSSLDTRKLATLKE